MIVYLNGTYLHAAGAAVSLFDGMAHWMTVPLLYQIHGDGAPPRVGLSHPSIAPYGVYDCVDGQVVICIQNQREWRRFCEVVIDRPAVADDPRFIDNPARVANRPALDREIASVFGLLLRGDLIDRLTKGSIAYGAVNSVADLAAHPQLRLATAETPGGPVELVAPPARIAGEAPQFGAVPPLNQHGDAIRQEFA